MDRLAAYDLGLLYWFLDHRPAWMEGTLMALTQLGNLLVLASVTCVGAGVLILLRRTRLAGILFLVALLAMTLDWGGKHLVGRPRPNVAGALAEPPALPSFPSGHALGTMAVYGTLGLFLGRVWPKLTPYLVTAGVLLSLTVGLTRVLIGVHYPFDVLAGWLAGVLCLLLAAGLAGPPVSPAP